MGSGMRNTWGLVGTNYPYVATNLPKRLEMKEQGRKALRQSG